MRIFVQEFGSMQGHCGKQESDTFMITSNLPESIMYSMESQWGTPLNFMTNEYLNMAAQFIAPGVGLGDKLPSMFNRATTLQVWKGANPLKLRFEIPVIDDGVTDSHTNLVEALEFLGSLVLPGQGNKLGFLTPPPAPTSLNIKYSKDKAELNLKNVNYGRITILLGGILLLDNMIVKGVTVNYPNTKVMVRHNYAGFTTGVGTGAGQEYLTPLLAKVTIDVETIEAITKEVYSKMLWLKPQMETGKMSIDFPATAEAIKDTGAELYEGAKDISKQTLDVLAGKK